ETVRQVFFFDTPDLHLNQAGIVVRARRVQGRGDDTVVKLRPVMPDEMDDELRKSPNLVVELDAMPNGFVCSASMKGVPKKATVRDVVNGTGGTIKQLFTKEQRAFYTDHLPDAPDLDDLRLLGPITVFKVNLRPKELGQKLVGEMWLYPDYSRILELSTKCPPADTLRVAFETRRFLEKRGLHIGGDQQTKTKTALEFFTSHLGA
ncbi:MAG TPA: adenylate cyclase, partial [Acidimicrobiia bacterium]|nr:adenylate cyclase [Acidimicrobiia bacterium]